MQLSLTRHGALRLSFSLLARMGLPRGALARDEDVADAVTADFGKIAPQIGRVTVTFGACTSAGEGDGLPEGWQPQVEV